MASAHSQNLLAWALRYLKLGWPVFPLKPQGKIPLISKEEGGRGCLDASLNETQIRAWWEKTPNANIGLATGHRWFAVDIDIKSGGEETWDVLKYQHGGLPDTLEQVTGSGGKHILYRMPDFPVGNSAGKIGPGIDVRGRGGYIVACPSIHPEIRRAYLWDGADAIEAQGIAAAPAWLLSLIAADDKKPSTSQKVPDQITEGGRNNKLFKLASSLRRQGFSAEEILATLREVNQKRCSPPLPEAELRTIAESAGRYVPDPRATLFAGAPKKEPSLDSPEAELPLSAADVEAAVDDAIAKNDLLAGLNLAPDIAKLRLPDQIWQKAKLKRGFKDFPVRDFDRLLKEAAGERLADEPSPGEVADMTGGAAGPDLLPFPLTDSGNGERIVLLFGSELRFCVEMDKWLVWDGRRWEVDDSGAASQKAKNMARLLYAQAALLVDEGRRKTLQKHARDSESQAGISAALKRAATENKIPINAPELDQHPYLLNCLNGVIDLRSGALVPHERQYLMTKLCHVNYNPEAKTRKFMEFLDWAMGQNPEADVTERTVRMRGFLQRCFGYSLTGDVSERAVVVFYGAKGRNGKTTLLTLFRKVLGEYSTQIKISTLMQATKNQGDSADLADLFGARLVVTSEAEREHKLSEGQLKYLTAGPDAPIKIRRLYENYIEFIPTHTLFMDCNYRPKISEEGDAIWDRIKLVPFNMRIEKEDPLFDRHLGEKLLMEAEGVLAWAVRGAVAWKKEGLGDPPEVSQASQDWREHDDPLKQFIEDCCEVNLETARQPDGIWVKSADLAKAYEWWCKENRERFALGRERFAERLRSKGFVENRSRRADGKQARTWEGITIKDDVAHQMRNDGKYKSTLLED